MARGSAHSLKETFGSLLSCLFSPDPCLPIMVSMPFICFIPYPVARILMCWNWDYSICSSRNPPGEPALHVLNVVEHRRTSQIFRLSDLVKRLSLNVPDGARQHQGSQNAHLPGTASHCTVGRRIYAIIAIAWGVLGYLNRGKLSGNPPSRVLSFKSWKLSNLSRNTS